MQRLFGREEELTALVSRLDAALRGQGGVALIAGDAGIGKTSLARAVASAAASRGALVCWGRSSEGGIAPPYTPWSEALAKLNDKPTEPVHGLTALIGGDRPNGAAVAVEPGDAQRQLHDAVTRKLLTRSAQQPLLIVIDDLQWADQSSLDLFHYIGFFAVQAPLLLMGSYRDSEPEASDKLREVLVALRRESNATTITLQGLDKEAAVELLSTVASEPMSPTQATAIWDQTGGNPFYLSELGGHLGTSHGLQVRTSPPSEQTSTAIPDSVRQALLHRFHGLAPETQTALRHAAIFPAGFEFATLAAITDLEEDQLLDAIDEALIKRWLTPDERAHERYAFTHAIVRQVLYEEWSPSRRTRLHRRVAEALAAGDSGLSGHNANEIALHYSESRSLPDASNGVRFAVTAANQAAKQYATDQVVEFLRIARDLSIESAGTLVELLQRLAVAEAEALRISESVPTTWQAVTMMESRAESPEAISTFLAEIAEALKHRAGAEAQIWQPLVERGLALVADSRGIAWARLQLLLDPVEPVARSPIRTGRWLGFDAEAIAIARRDGDESDQARSYESFDARSREETDELVARARKWTQPAAILHALTVAGNDYHYRHGAYREARALWREIAELAASCQAIAWQAQATNQLTLLAIAQGDFEEAAELEEEANALLYQLGPGRRPDLFATEMATARAIYQGGDWEQLSDFWADLADDPSLAPGDTGTLAGPIMAAFAIYAMTELGDRQRAERLLAVLTPILESLPATAPNQNGAVALAAGAVWHFSFTSLAPAYRLLTQQLIAHRLGDYPQTSLALTMARMEALLGRHDEAGTAFASARRGAGEKGVRPVAAITMLDEARWHLQGHGANLPEVESLLSRAEQLLSELQMIPWLSRSANLRGELERQQGNQPLPAGLTERELDVLRLVARGRPDKEIAEELYISPRTVNAHLRNMFGKTGTGNRTELSMWAATHGLVAEETPTSATTDRYN
jgi:DNA-binding CsgD family transcriptional regulator